MCLTVAGEVARTWPSEESWRFLALGEEGKGQREREEGRGQSPHTLSFILSLQQTAFMGTLWGGTQSDKLIPKGLCPARALVLLRGDNELMSHEPGENGKEGRRAGSWR